LPAAVSFCVLSVVGARRQRRLLYEVLDHDPTHYDILSFLAHLQERLSNAIDSRRGYSSGVLALDGLVKSITCDEFART